MFVVQGASSTLAAPPASEDWDEIKAKTVFVCAFERREPEAWARKTSSVPLENEIVSVCMATRDLNAPHFEPQAADPGQCDSILQGIRLMITQVMAASPGFTKQLQQLLANKERSIDMSRNNTCWNCGKPGHVRARCPEPRRHYSTDFKKG